MKKNTIAFTLVELLLVVGIISSLALVSFEVYKKWKMSWDAEQSAQKVRFLFNEVKKMQLSGFLSAPNTDPDPAGRAARLLVEAKLVPQQWIETSLSTAQTPVFNTEVGTIVVSADSESAYYYFQPKDRQLCAPFINKMYDSVDVFMVPTRTGTISSGPPFGAYTKPSRETIIANCNSFETVPWGGIWASMGLTQIFNKNARITFSS